MDELMSMLDKIVSRLGLLQEIIDTEVGKRITVVFKGKAYTFKKIK